MALSESGEPESHDKADPERAADLPAAHGFHSDGWFVEQGLGAVRSGFRVKELLCEEQSEFQKISVYESAFFGRILTLDDVMMLTERDEFVYHEMLLHVPLLEMREPKSVLIIGGGDCGCLREALKHPSVERVVQCDIDERVTRVSEQFFPWVRAAAADPRAELIFDDGVAYLENNTAAFDLIVVDSTDPVGPAVGLFQRDFYARVAASLKPGGIMTAQTESPHWHAPVVSQIHREIGRAFAHVSAYLTWMPAYPSGCWSLGFAGAGPRTGIFDRGRADAIAATCKYYNAQVHESAFALPEFARRAVEGDNVFERFDNAQRRLLQDENQ